MLLDLLVRNELIITELIHIDAGEKTGNLTSQH